MNKTDLVECVAQKCDLPKTVASTALDTILDAIVESVEGGDPVVLVGFGSFEKTTRSARAGRNPQTGEVIQIKASNTVKFKVGKKFKDEVNKNGVSA